MLSHVYKENTNHIYKVAILIKELSFNIDEIKKYYIHRLLLKGILLEDIIILGLHYNEKNKAPVKLIKEHLNKSIYPAIDKLEVKYLLVTDPAYFKVMAGVRKVEPHYGYMLECTEKNHTHLDLSISINFAALFYNPTYIDKLELSIKVLTEKVISGFFIPLGSDIIHSEYYPETLSEIRDALLDLHQYDVITCDIETFSLRLEKAGIGTIGFAWDQHNGISFCVDIYSSLGKAIRMLLATFFAAYKGTIIYHGGTFDIRVLIYNIYMQDPLDLEGMIPGLHIMYRNIHDTKLITYLATNTTSGNNLKLKDNTHEYTGNYAQDDIKDITKIPKDKLLRYNLTDCLATWYLYHKYYDRMVQDQQLEIYTNIFIPSMKVITQIELTGMPLDMDQVAIAKKDMIAIWNANKDILDCPLIWNFENVLRAEACKAHNKKLKKKVNPLSNWDDLEFNPGSTKQLAKFLYEYMGFEIIDTTDTGLPATGAKTIKKLRNQLISKYNITDEELL